jgi:hypothetical protein
VCISLGVSSRGAAKRGERENEIGPDREKGEQQGGIDKEWTVDAPQCDEIHQSEALPESE